RLRRHPLPGRESLQETDRDLLAAGGAGEDRRYPRPAPRHHRDLALPPRLARRRATTVSSLSRLPSLIGAIGAVLLTYWAALAFVSRRAAVLAGVIMATSILLGVEARLA